MKPSEYLNANFDRFIEDFKSFVRIPSVSTDPAYATEVLRAARWTAAALKGAGFHEVAVNPTPGHPIVTAERLDAPGAPTVLVYGHYDVQPPDPLEAWETPPFEPDIRNGKLHGRGASDDKGPILTAIKVAEAFLSTTGRLPVNVKMLIEGEEECGSVNLEAFVRAHADRLKADFVLSADGAMWRPDEPSVTVSCRGWVAVNFRLQGAKTDLHSGRHGGGIANPLHAMARLLASLHDDDGRVAVDGFYDRVVAPDPMLRDYMARLPFDEAAYLDEIGVDRSVGEAGFTCLERQWLRPTLEVNGLHGGYGGPGSKTIVPAAAEAKITCRLVPDQDHRIIHRLLVSHLEAHCPPGVALHIRTEESFGIDAYAIPGDHPGLRLAERVLGEICGKPSLRVGMGATIPLARTIRDALGIDTVFFSFSTSKDNYHAPNEHFAIDRFRDGMAAWMRMFEVLPSAWDDLHRQRSAQG